MPYPYNFSPYAQNYLPQSYTTTAPVQQRQSAGIPWVQGEVGVKAQFVAPGTSGMFMDSEQQRFYIKTVDASGIPAPLRVFEYNEITQSDDPVKPDEYVTRAELERRLAELKDKAKEEDDEPAV